MTFCSSPAPRLTENSGVFSSGITVRTQVYRQGDLWPGWHWHPEFELVRVSQGHMACLSGSEISYLTEGDTLFVNSNIIHKYMPDQDNSNVSLQVIHFTPALIADPGSLIFQSYVKPIIDCRTLSCARLSGKADWQKSCRTHFDRLMAMDRDSLFGYELSVRNELSEIWLLLAANTRSVYQNSASESHPTYEARTRSMLSYVKAFYYEDITIDDIAASASISRSECFRCFRKTINKKPNEYLTEYRVERALGYLRDSRMSITNVCRLCGFSSISYFGKVFRGVTGITPRAFRQNNNISD